MFHVEHKTQKMIYFYNENTKYILKQKIQIKKWIVNCIIENGFTLKSISIVFCDDEYLLQINQKSLKHDYYTDIITFQYNYNKQIEGDLFVSIERVKDNAKQNAVSFIDELHRVIIHGVLHLSGFKDKTPKDKLEMTKQENNYLQKRSTWNIEN